jgi:hypothetical protein
MKESAVVMSVRTIFSFPDPVNETSARFVAAGVVVQTLFFLVVQEGWLLIALVYGFLARVLTGPTLSPLGQLSTRVLTPWSEQRWARSSRRVPGPPKRFAQAIGLAFSASAAFAWYAGAPVVAALLIVALATAAALEATAAVCLGCIAYSAIWGCADCDDIGDRLRAAVVEARRAAV